MLNSLIVLYRNVTWGMAINCTGHHRTAPGHIVWQTKPWLSHWLKLEGLNSVVSINRSHAIKQKMETQITVPVPSTVQKAIFVKPLKIEANYSQASTGIHPFG